MRRAAVALVSIVLIFLLPSGIALAKSGGGDESDSSKEGEGAASVSWEDVKKLSDEKLKAELAAIKEELIELNRRLAELSGPAHEEQRNVVKAKITSLERRAADIAKELERRKRERIAKGIEQIKAKYRAQIEALVKKQAQARRKAIRKFEQLLAERGESPLAPDILLRLAQLYFEQANDEYLERMAEYEKLEEQLMEEGGDVELPPMPRRDYSKSIEIYRKILERYPNYEHADGAAYLLAYCLAEQGDEDSAKTIYEQLIEKYPDSPYVPEAHVRLGEHYFNRNQYDRAIEQYELVLNYPVSSFYDKALYKLGWSYYLLNRYDEAISYFTKVIDFYEEGRGRRAVRGEDLKAESMTYIAICFAEKHPFGGGEQEAAEYFASIGSRPWEREILVRIGDVYFESASYFGARSAYNAALERFPLHPDNPAVWKKIVECYEREGDYDLAIEERERFAERFGPGTEWWNANKDDPDAIRASTEMVANALYAAATFHHELAQQEQDEGRRVALYLRAAKDYERFLQYFPDHASSYNARFQVAECYYFARRYSKAARHYEMVIKDPNGKYFQDAAYSLVRSYDNLVETTGGLPGAGLPIYIPEQRSELKPEAQKLVQACRFYIDHFPDDPKNPDLMFKMGEIYLRYGHLEEARKVFDELIERYPAAPAAKVAANRIIESYKVEGREDMVALYGQKVLELGTLVKSPEERAKLESIIQGAVFLEGRKLQEKGEYAAAVDKYLEAARRYPKQEHAPKALHNAAVLTENQLKDLYRANDIYLELIRRYPDSENAKVDLFHAAYNYERLAEFELAAKTYLDYYRLYPESEQAMHALFNAALLYEAMGNRTQAIKLYGDYVRRYSGQPDAPLIEAKRCRMIGELQMYDEYSRCLNGYIRSFKGRGEMIWAYVELAKLAEKLGRTRDAEKRYAQAVAVYRASRKQGIPISAGEIKSAAEAAFALAEPKYRRYEAIQFTLPQSKMKRQIERKAKLWKELTQSYQDIVRMGDLEWGIAALYRLGMINKLFADALFNAPVPPGMTKEEEDAYRFVLEEQAFPIEDRAVKAFKACVQKAQEKRFWNRWVEKSYKALVEYGEKVDDLHYIRLESLSSGLPLFVEEGGS